MAERDIQIELAAKTGPDLPRFDKDLVDPKRKEEALADMREAEKENIESPPPLRPDQHTGETRSRSPAPVASPYSKEAVDALYQEQPEI